MKKFRIFTILLLVCALIFTFTACNKKDEEGRIILNSPKNIKIEGDVVTWDEVKNANGYAVSINGAEEIKTMFTIFSISVKEVGSYTVKVKTCGDGKSFADSAFSKDFTYVKTKLISSPAVRVEGTKVVWGAIEGAAGYKMTIIKKDAEKPMLEMEFNAETLEFVLPEANFSKPGAYYISMVTVGKDSTSAKSNVAEYVKSVKLNAPTNFTYADGMLKWDKVALALNYTIVATKQLETGETEVVEVVKTDISSSTNSISVTSTEISSYKINLEKAGTYSFKIKAFGDDKVYLNSDFVSTDKVATKLPTPTATYDTSTKTINWNDIANEGGYTVQFYKNAKDNSPFEQTYDANKSSAKVDDPALKINTDSNMQGYILNFGIIAKGTEDKIYLDSDAYKVDVKHSYMTFKEPTIKNGIYEITNAGELGFVVNNADKNYKFKLAQDIDMSGRRWRAIGYENVGSMKAFVGEFDGNNKVIKNFIIDENYNEQAGAVGFFAKVASGSKIFNLNLIGAEYKTVSNNLSVGGFVGENNGEIKNCVVGGFTNNEASALKSTMDITNSNAGGFAGINNTNGAIIGCNSSVLIKNAGKNAGGFVAENRGLIVGGSSYLNVSGAVAIDGEIRAYYGGFAGINSGKIAYSFANGGIDIETATKSTNKAYGAGFVARNDSAGVVESCYSIGNAVVNASGINAKSFAGGFVANNMGKVTDCYSDGTVRDAENCGAFASYNSSIITNCFTNSNIVNATKKAGFVVNNSGTITTSHFNKGNVSDMPAIAEGTQDNVAAKDISGMKVAFSCFAFNDASIVKKGYATNTKLLYVSNVFIKKGKGAAINTDAEVKAFYGGTTTAVEPDVALTAVANGTFAHKYFYTVNFENTDYQISLCKYLYVA
ncbi:MAG: hypothetical protein RR454_01115 [Clostridia bacterium]